MAARHASLGDCCVDSLDINYDPYLLSM